MRRNVLTLIGTILLFTAPGVAFCAEEAGEASIVSTSDRLAEGSIFDDQSETQNAAESKLVRYSLSLPVEPSPDEVSPFVRAGVTPGKDTAVTVTIGVSW